MTSSKLALISRDDAEDAMRLSLLVLHVAIRWHAYPRGARNLPRPAIRRPFGTIRTLGSASSDRYGKRIRPYLRSTTHREICDFIFSMGVDIRKSTRARADDLLAYFSSPAIKTMVGNPWATLAKRFATLAHGIINSIDRAAVVISDRIDHLAGHDHEIPRYHAHRFARGDAGSPGTT